MRCGACTCTYGCVYFEHIKCVPYTPFTTANDIFILPFLIHPFTDLLHLHLRAVCCAWGGRKRKKYSVEEKKEKSRTCYVKCAYMLSPLNNKYPKGKAHIGVKNENT